MEVALRSYLVEGLGKKRLISLFFVMISPIIIYFSGSAIGALFLLILITSSYGLYIFNRDLRIVTNGKFLEYRFTGYLERGRIVNKWYVPTVEDPEDKKRVIAENLIGYLPKESKVFGFKNGDKHFFVNEKVISKVQ